MTRFFDPGFLGPECFPPGPECPIGWDVNKKWRPFLISIFSAPLGARTLDPNIKSVVLYQLS